MSCKKSSFFGSEKKQEGVKIEKAEEKGVFFLEMALEPASRYRGEMALPRGRRRYKHQT